MANRVSIKLVVVGDGTVGKTCILLSYSKDEFPTGYVPTIFDNYTAQIAVNDKIVSLGLWDTAGQEEYQRLRVISYPNTDVFLIVFDVTQASSFENATKKWYPELREQNKNAIKIFLGNKIDLRDNKKCDGGGHISQKTAQIVIENMGHKYFECSALTRQGLKEVFDNAIVDVFEQKFKPEKKKFSCNIV